MKRRGAASSGNVRLRTRMKSILQTVLVIGVEMGIRMERAGVGITLDWIASDKWRAERERAIERALRLALNLVNGAGAGGGRDEGAG